MHHRPIRVNPNRAVSKSLPTHPAMPILANHDALIPSAYRSAIRAQQQRRLDVQFFDGAQLGDDALLVHDARGAANAAAEVGFQVRDG